MSDRGRRETKTGEMGKTHVSPVIFLCDSKNKPPAMQGEGRSLDISNLLC